MPICRELKLIWKKCRWKKTLPKPSSSSSWGASGGNWKLGLPLPWYPQQTQPELKSLVLEQIGMTRIYKVRFPLSLQTSPLNLLVFPRRRSWKFSGTSSSPSTSAGSDICEISSLRSTKTRKRSVSRMVYQSYKEHREYIKIIVAVFIKFGQRPSSTTSWS